MLNSCLLESLPNASSAESGSERQMPYMKRMGPDCVTSGTPAAADRRVHDEQCVRYSHEMPLDLQEAIGRFIFRVVPLLYGGMFGVLTHEMPIAMTIGVLVSTGMDLAMGPRSIMRSMAQPVVRGGCPVLAAVARATARLIRMVGLKAPPALSDMRCGVS